MKTKKINTHLNEKSLASYLDIPYHTLRYWRKTGQGPKFKRLFNGKVRYFMADIDKFCEKQLKEGV